MNPRLDTLLAAVAIAAATAAAVASAQPATDASESPATATLPAAATMATATAPTAPAAAPQPATAPETSPLPPATNLREGLQLDDAERTILDAVRDGTREYKESGLYVLLRRAAALPKLTTPQLDSLSTISINSIMSSPEEFRRTRLPVKMTVRVSRIEEFTPGKDFRVDKRWPRDPAGPDGAKAGGPVWWIGAVDWSGKSPSRVPVIIVSVADPRPAMPTPSKIERDGKLWRYETAQQVELAAIFYKVYEDTSEGSPSKPPEVKQYPVFVAWQVGRSEPVSDIPWMWIAAAVSMAILVVLFFVFRKRAKNAKVASLRVGFRGYRPLREEPAAPDPQNAQPQAGPDVEIDPALKQAAEQFKKQKRSENG